MAPIRNPVFIFGFFINALALNEFAARQECPSKFVTPNAQELNNIFKSLKFNSSCTNCPTKACIQGYLMDCVSNKFSNLTKCNNDEACLAYPIDPDNQTTIGCLKTELIEFFFEGWNYSSGPVGLRSPRKYGSLLKLSLLLGNSTNEKRLDDSDGKTRG